MNIQPGVPFVPLGIPQEVSKDLEVQSAPQSSLPFVRDEADTSHVSQTFTTASKPLLESPLPTIDPGKPISISDLALLISLAFEELNDAFREADRVDVKQSLQSSIAQASENGAAGIAAAYRSPEEGTQDTTSLPSVADNPAVPAEHAKNVHHLETNYVPRHNARLQNFSFSNPTPPTLPFILAAALLFKAATEPSFGTERGLYTNLTQARGELEEAFSKHGSNLNQEIINYNNTVDRHNAQILQLNQQRALLGLPKLPLEEKVSSGWGGVFSGFSLPKELPALSLNAQQAMFVQPKIDAAFALSSLVMTAVELGSSPLLSGLFLPWNGISPDRESMFQENLIRMGVPKSSADKAIEAAKLEGPHLSEAAFFDAVKTSMVPDFLASRVDQASGRLPDNPLKGMTSIAHRMVALTEAYQALVLEQNLQIASFSSEHLFNVQVDKNNEKILEMNIGRSLVGLPLIPFQEKIADGQKVNSLQTPQTSAEVLLNHYSGVQAMSLALIEPLVKDAIAFSLTSGFPISLGSLANLAESIIVLANAFIALAALQNEGIGQLNQATGLFGPVVQDNKKIDGMNQALTDVVSGKIGTEDFNKEATKFNGFAEKRNGEIANYNAAATIYNMQVDVNNLQIQSQNVGRALVGLPLIPLQEKAPLLQPLPTIPSAPFSSPLEPLASLATLTAIDPIKTPDSAETLLVNLFNPVQEAALSLVGWAVSGKVQEFAAAKAALLGMVFPQSFVSSLSNIYFASPVSSPEDGAKALAFGIGQPGIQTLLNTKLFSPAAQDAVQIFALQAMTRLSSIAVVSALGLLGSDVSKVSPEGVVLSSVLAFSLLGAVKDMVASGALDRSVQNLTGEENQQANNSLAFSLLMTATARFAFSLGFPALLPLIGASLFGTDAIKGAAGEQQPSLQDPLVALYVKAALVNTLVFGQGLSQAIAELKINVAFNQAIAQGGDFSKAFGENLGKVGFTPEIASSLSTTAGALLQMEMATTILALAFVQNVQTALLLETLAPLFGGQNISLEDGKAALDQTINGNKLETMRDFAFGYAVNLMLLGVAAESAIIIASAAANFLATGSIDGKEREDPTSVVTKQMTKDADNFRELLIKTTTERFFPQVGMRRANFLANEIVLLMLGASKTGEPNEEATGTVSLMDTLGGLASLIGDKQGLLAIVAALTNPGGDVAFLLEKMFEPALEISGTYVSGTREVNGQGEGRPPEVQV